MEPGLDEWLTLEAAHLIFQRLKSQGVIEILILSGEVHPHHPKRKAWFQHIYQLCELALSYGYLPHTNAGPLSYAEMAQLKTVNASIGLMVEQVTLSLLETVHRHAPSKEPNLRLQQLDWAGELRIPFTTGLLLGIGETEADWEDSLQAIAHSHNTWGHIQEVILQPHSPGHQQAFSGKVFPAPKLPEVVALARQLLPNEIEIQIPPNLVSNPEVLHACLQAGARDLGGISPKDEVNPDYPQMMPEQIAATIESEGWSLHPRLPVYPHHDHWLSEAVQRLVKDWRLALAPYEVARPEST
jgi:7,8-didemethyl-8-hydroxy-5-deazariboflavin synthase